MLAILLALPFMGWVQVVSFDVLIAVGGAGALIAIIGFMDLLEVGLAVAQVGGLVGGVGGHQGLGDVARID
ncbi:hypothetical protein, partial [Vibrio cholerae]|uniref:hypothetical protein n=1 Tax=Vibrio cholerae TaxID=666 RepID=UPI001BCB63B3